MLKPTELILILGMAAVTYLCRYGVLALVSRVVLPKGLLGAMQFIPTAVLTAIVVPTLFLPGGDRLDLSLGNSNLIAGLVAALTAWWSNNLLLTIGVGMATVWVWRWLIALVLG